MARANNKNDIGEPPCRALNFTSDDCVTRQYRWCTLIACRLKFGLRRFALKYVKSTSQYIKATSIYFNFT